MDIPAVQKRLAEFAEAREWQQFHSPKNLSMALAAEAAELLEIFQWLTEEQSRALRSSARDRERVAEEVADVLIYALRLADILGIDVEKAVGDKIALNETKYPAERSRGTAVKYNRRER